jgi:hypothetical protein
VVTWRRGGGGIVGTEFTALPAPTLFGTDVGSALQQTDYTGSLRLVFDTRNREYNPGTGALLQAGALVGNAYGRYYGDFRGFVSPFYTTVVAGRLTAVTVPAARRSAPTMNCSLEESPAVRRQSEPDWPAGGPSTPTSSAARGPQTILTSGLRRQTIAF